MTVLLQLRAKSAFQGFVSTSYIGNIVAEDDKSVTIEKACAVYEMLNSDKRGDVTLVIKYYTNSIITNGKLIFQKEDFLMRREIAEEDEILDGYHSAVEAFRLDKVGIKRAANMREVPAGREPSPIERN